MRYQRYHYDNSHCIIVGGNRRVFEWTMDDGVRMREEVMQWMRENVGEYWQAWEFDTVSRRVYFRHERHAMLFKLTWS